MITYIKIGLVAAVLGALTAFHFNAINKAEERINNKWEQAQLINDLDRSSRENAIINNALELEREKNEEISKINLAVNNLRYSLRNRPSRETIVYRDNPGIAQTCTGAELSREDGEFLAGEAARAEVLIKERDFYYKQYEQVRIELNERNKSQ